MNHFLLFYKWVTETSSKSEGVQWDYIFMGELQEDIPEEMGEEHCNWGTTGPSDLSQSPPLQDEHTIHLFTL